MQQKLCSESSLTILGPKSGFCQGFSSGQEDASCHTIRIAVGCWTSVFHVALSLCFSSARNANGGATVSNTKLELVDAASLVEACETLVVALTILSDVLSSNLAEGLTNLLDDFIPAGLA